jgi:glyoxylase-like metal-dependent hydrolase (beta-lactamase superfamily II)
MILESLSVGPLEENCYLIGAAPRCAVVDPGAESDRIFAAIERQGLKPEAVVLTHGHVDHIAHVPHVCERYGIGLLVHRADLPYLERPQWPELEALLGARPCPKPSGWLEEGSPLEVAGLALEVLHTPGHTPGGVCLVDRGSRQILVGDTLFQGSVGRTDLPGGDWRTLSTSIRTKLFALEGDYELFPGHGPATTLAAERLDNPFVGRNARYAPG